MVGTVMIPFGTVPFTVGTSRYGWYGFVRFGTVLYGLVRFCTISYGLVRFCMIENSKFLFITGPFHGMVGTVSTVWYGWYGWYGLVRCGTVGTVLYGLVRFCTISYGLVWFGTVENSKFLFIMGPFHGTVGTVSTVWYGRYGLVRFGTVWYGLVRFGTVLYSLVRSVPFGAVWNNNMMNHDGTRSERWYFSGTVGKILSVGVFSENTSSTNMN